jgi:hypothetical protein
MEKTPSEYFTAYRSLRLTRDAHGVLVAEFHTKGGPFTFSAPITPNSSKPFIASRRIVTTRS